MLLRRDSQFCLSNKNSSCNKCTNGRGQSNLCTNKSHLLSNTKKHIIECQLKYSLFSEDSIDYQKRQGRCIYTRVKFTSLCTNISLCDDKQNLTCSRDENSYFNFVLSGLLLTLYNSVIQQMLGAAQLQSFKKILNFDVRTSSKYVRKTLKIKHF